MSAVRIPQQPSLLRASALLDGDKGELVEPGDVLVEGGVVHRHDPTP